MKRFWEERDVVARQYGFKSYCGVLRHAIESQPKTKPDGKQFENVMKILNWGRDNCVHLEKLRRAEGSQANSFGSEIALDPSSVVASTTPLHDPNP